MGAVRKSCGSAKDLGIELVGRNKIGAGEQVGELRDNRAQLGISHGARAEPLPQLFLTAPIGEVEQSVLVDTKEGSLQYRGKCQVILRQQQKPTQGDQILHGELLGQDQPVGAGHRDVALLQRTQQLADKLVAAPYQHHDIAGANWAAAGLEHLSVIEPASYGGCDRKRKPCAGLGDALACDRQRDRVGRLFRLRQYRRPDLDEPRMPGTGRNVANLAAFEGYAVMRCLMPENHVDRMQYRLGRPKRDIEGHDPPILSGGSDALFEIPPHRHESARVGALKTVDRLLCVPDGKNRAVVTAGTVAGEELPGECRGDFPLLRVGVLRFVDQDVIETAIQLEENPRRRLAPPKQLECL